MNSSRDNSVSTPIRKKVKRHLPTTHFKRTNPNLRSNELKIVKTVDHQKLVNDLEVSRNFVNSLRKSQSEHIELIEKLKSELSYKNRNCENSIISSLKSEVDDLKKNKILIEASNSQRWTVIKEQDEKLFYLKHQNTSNENKIIELQRIIKKQQAQLNALIDIDDDI